jgi:hypothetical protein
MQRVFEENQNQYMQQLQTLGSEIQVEMQL